MDNKPFDFNYTIEYKEDSFCNMYTGACSVIMATEYDEILSNGVKHSIIEISDSDIYDNTPLIIVPENHYFFMGDDRDNSSDSRANLGTVPYDNILGKVWFVWYSHNYYAPLLAVWTYLDKIRFERFGLGIK